MTKTLLELIDPMQIITWLIIAFLVGYFIYKEYPEFKRRVTGKEISDKSVSDRLTAIEMDVKLIKEKLDRDYGRLNDMERWKRTIDSFAAESLEEREILMQAMLGVLGGLQELGANGRTTEASEKIQNYINKQAHKCHPSNSALVVSSDYSTAVLHPESVTVK